MIVLLVLEPETPEFLVLGHESLDEGLPIHSRPPSCHGLPRVRTARQS
jgi:hypothetical protein